MKAPRTQLRVVPFTKRDVPRPTNDPRLEPDNIRARLIGRLSRLDGPQLQIVEIVVAAIERGVLPTPGAQTSG